MVGCHDYFSNGHSILYCNSTLASRFASLIASKTISIPGQIKGGCSGGLGNFVEEIWKLLGNGFPRFFQKNA